MPKKTRREKVRAQERRTIPGGYTFQATLTSPSAPHTKTVVVDTGELRAVKAELFKTTILALAAIGIEFFLFFRAGGKF